MKSLTRSFSFSNGPKSYGPPYFHLRMDSKPVSKRLFVAPRAAWFSTMDPKEETTAKVLKQARVQPKGDREAEIMRQMENFIVHNPNDWKQYEAKFAEVSSTKDDEAYLKFLDSFILNYPTQLAPKLAKAEADRAEKA